MTVCRAEAIEKGITPSGKKMVPRDLAWVTKQRPKPEDDRTAVCRQPWSRIDCRRQVLAVKAETLERAVRLAGNGSETALVAQHRTRMSRRSEVGSAAPTGGRALSSRMTCAW